MWPGSYKVTFEVKDAQNQACTEPQKVEIQVCTCEDGVTCGEKGGNGKVSKDVVFGPAGIGLLFLGLLMLLRKSDVKFTLMLDRLKTLQTIPGHVKVKYHSRH